MFLPKVSVTIFFPLTEQKITVSCLILSNLFYVFSTQHQIVQERRSIRLVILV